MDADDIIAALESTAKGRPPHKHSDRSPTPDQQDIRLYRDQLLRFLRELDTDLTVGEMVEALDSYA